MSNLEQVAAFPVGSNADKALQRALLTKRMPYGLEDTDNLQTIDVVDPAAGTVPLYIVQLARLFKYDPLDSTTAHDGTTCLVSQDGKRFKVVTFDYPSSVLDKDLTAPPVSPSVGDEYIAGVASTGDWSGHDNAIAVYTEAGWQFITAPIGKLFYVEDETAFYHRNAGGTWTRGVGSLAFAANAIAISSLIGKPVRHIVVNQTTNAPPGSPTTGVTYIIGPSPTGAWSGLAGKLAICEDGATFTVYTPRTGERAYDQALGKEVLFNGTSWDAGADAFVLIQSQVASASATIDFTTGLNDTYDAYEIRISSLKPATDDTVLWLRVGTGGGPTYQTAGYIHGATGVNSSGVAVIENSASDAKIAMAKSTAANAIGSAGGENCNVTIKFNNPESSDFCIFDYDVSYRNASNQTTSMKGTGWWDTAGAITAIRFMMSSGNIAAGRFSLYGLRKS